MNLDCAATLLQQLRRLGVSTICLCPGGRNAPFVALLENSEDFEIISFFDERSAAFFALGRAQRDSAPAVVLTTSGTAVSELFSAAIEAYYTNTPLVLVTADRPRRLRGSGAPQAIEQVGLFSPYFETVDLVPGEDTFIEINSQGPSHINVCFDEPLMSGDGQVTGSLKLSPITKNEPNLEPISTSFSRPLVVVGGLSKADQDFVKEIVKTLQLPVYCEALSGIKGAKDLAKQSLPGGDQLVRRMLQSGEVDAVIRLGDVPVGKFWRLLDQMELPVLVFNNKDFAGLEKAVMHCRSFSTLTFDFLKNQSWDFSHWQQMGKQLDESKIKICEQFPLSEPALFLEAVSKIEKDNWIYLGNSMPVRLWNLFSRPQIQSGASRGANGIDGQLSTAFARMQPGSENWVVLGDLTTLYDSNGLWVSPYLREQNITVNLLVINNGGGKIFNRLFSQKLFQNQHQLSFRPMAEQWGWDYFSFKDWQSATTKGTLNFIEVRPDEEQTESFWQELSKL